MKTVKFFLGALALAVVSSLAAPQMSAQEAERQEENKDADGKTIRHPYLTNGLWANWFLGVAGGVNIAHDENEFMKPGLALDVNLGKWVTPSVGVRLGWNGLKANAWDNNYQWNYIHGDVMWNISNAIGGYKDSRFWNFVPYAHAGYLTVSGDQELSYGFGLLNILRLCNRLDLTLDIRGGAYSDRVYQTNNCAASMFTATLGLSVDLGKNKWTRACDYHNPEDLDKLSAADASAAALAAANAALAADNSKLNSENEALKDENDKLANALKDAEGKANGIAEVGPASFYFEIGQTKLSEKELAHLDFYMKNVLPNVKNGKATVITGTADSNTGYAKRNEYLSKKRAEYVIDLLQSKYGINTDNIVVKNQVIKAAAGKAALDRAVVVSFE